MEEQQGTSWHSVLFAGLAFVCALTLFGAVLYYFDGLTLITDVIAGVRGQGDSTVAQSREESSSTELLLPSGMTEELALQLWQEQVDSQEMIGKLVGGSLTALVVTKVETSASDATLTVSARLEGEPSVPGVIGLRKLGGKWFVAFASARANGKFRGLPGEPADIEDVDISLLNTVIAEQAKSQPVFGEYVAGTVHKIDIDKVNEGPRTVTIDVSMNEDHGTGYAQIVAIKDESSGSPRWFLARFVKTGDYLKKD